MKKLNLNNTVIELIDYEHGQKVKEFWKERGFNILGFAFDMHKKDNNTFRFYGNIDGRFSNYEECQLKNIRIATLDELEAEEKGEVREIDYYLVNKECWAKDGRKFEIGGKLRQVQFPDSFNYLKEIALLSNPEYFTPVYKEVPKFKVGETVVITETPKEPHWASSGEYKGKLFKIVSEKKGYGERAEKMRHEIQSVHIKRSGGMPDDCMRLATPSEIAEAERPKVGDKVKILYNGFVCTTHSDMTGYKGFNYGENIAVGSIATIEIMNQEWLVLRDYKGAYRASLTSMYLGTLDKYLRHATPSEIAEAERPKVGDYCKNTWLDGDVSYYHVSRISNKMIFDDEYYNVKSGGNIIVTNKTDDPCAYFDSKNYKIEVITKAEFDEVKQRYLAAQKIMIGGYEVEITSTEMIKINGTWYSKKELIYLNQLFNKGQVKSLNVGCSGQYKVTQEQIEQILAKLK